MRKACFAVLLLRFAAISMKCCRIDVPPSIFSLENTILNHLKQKGRMLGPDLGNGGVKLGLFVAF